MSMRRSDVKEVEYNYYADNMLGHILFFMQIILPGENVAVNVETLLRVRSL